jgi:hypothetical protein
VVVAQLASYKIATETITTWTGCFLRSTQHSRLLGSSTPSRLKASFIT